MEKQNFGNLKEMVEKILIDYPKTRNSDVELTLACWWVFYQDQLFQDENGDWSVRLKDIKNFVREDNVKRVRAKFNEQGSYLATNSVVLERRRKAKKWKKDLGYAVEKGVTPELF